LQADGETGAGRRVVAVGHIDLPVMAFDDCAGDRKTESRMAAEALGRRPYGMEAVENRLSQLLGNSRPFVIDPDSDFIADMGRGDLDQASGWRKADCIVDDVVDRPR